MSKYSPIKSSLSALMAFVLIIANPAGALAESCQDKCGDSCSCIASSGEKSCGSDDCHSIGSANTNRSNPFILDKQDDKSSSQASSTSMAPQLFEEAAVNGALSSSTVGAPEITAQSAILIEANTGVVLYEKDSHQRRSPASITKIMTALLVMEKIESGELTLDQKLTCSEHASSMGGSQIWLKPGEEMSVDDLLKAMMVNSANDASAVFAESIAGSEPQFVDMMNAKAKELGMNETTFRDASGLDEDDGRITSAYDVALMSRALLMHPMIIKYSTIWMDSLRGGETELANTNKLIRTYNGITGLKTGTTDLAGSCLSATAERDGLSLVAVVLGSEGNDNRFSDAKSMLDYGFNAFKIVDPGDPPEGSITPIKVLRGEKSSIMPYYESVKKVMVPRGREKQIEQRVELIDQITAPVKKGQKLGTVGIYLDDKKISEYELVANQDIGQMNFLSGLRILLSHVITLNTK